MTDAIAALEIKKSDEQIEKKYNWNDLKYLEIPNVVGMDIKEASNLLKNFKVEYSGSGNIIKHQSPSAGKKIMEGEKIRILLTE